jgi:WD40 repeat protein
MDDLVLKRRTTISNYLVDFFPSDISKLISTYDYYLEGISYFLKNNEDKNICYNEMCFNVLYDNYSKNTYRLSEPYGKKYRLIFADNNIIKIWNPKTEEVDITFKGHLENIFCIAALPNESKEPERIISGSADRTLKIWNLKTGKCDVTLVGHSGAVRCVTSLSDGRIVSGSFDNKIKIWDQHTGECEITIDTRHYVFCVNVLPDERIVSGFGDGSIIIWNPKIKKRENSLVEYHELCDVILTGHMCSVYSIVVLFDQQKFRLVSGSREGTIKIWNVQTGTCDLTLKDEYYDAIKLQNMQTENFNMVFMNENFGSVDCIAILPDGRISCVLANGNVKIWDVNTGIGDSIFTVNSWLCYDYFRTVNCITVLPSGQIVSGTNKGSLIIWN